MADNFNDTLIPVQARVFAYSQSTILKMFRSRVRNFIHKYEDPPSKKRNRPMFVFTGGASTRAPKAIQIADSATEVIVVGERDEYDKMVPYFEEAGVTTRFIFASDTTESVDVVRREMLRLRENLSIIVSSIWHLPQIEMLCEIAGIDRFCTLYGAGNPKASSIDGRILSQSRKMVFLMRRYFR